MSSCAFLVLETSRRIVQKVCTFKGCSAFLVYGPVLFVIVFLLVLLRVREKRMGRAPCCDKMGLKKGPWTAEEDEILVKYIEENGGHGSWRALPKLAGFDASVLLLWQSLVYLCVETKHAQSLFSL